MQLIECVPNISEGRNEAIINQIVQSIVDTKDAYLLHKDIGYDVNRTVLTIAGSPSAVCEAAFKVITKTSELIDMRTHHGSHPRIGATDVCPIIPIANITMDECIALSKKLAYRVGNELRIPVYLYGESAQSPERKSLAYIRGGEYENLFLRIDELLFKPDFGPIVCNARSGATAIGARQILIAYNIHLDTKDLKIAKAIAQAIRERRQSHIAWQDVQAIGWYIKEYECCQVSLNLLNYKKTSLHQAFLAVSELASEFEISVTGSEIIGLVPLDALLATGKFVYKANSQEDANFPTEEHLLMEAVKFLKLDSFQSFKSEEKVLEYRLEQFGLTLSRSLD